MKRTHAPGMAEVVEALNSIAFILAYPKEAATLMKGADQKPSLSKESQQERNQQLMDEYARVYLS